MENKKLFRLLMLFMIGMFAMSCNSTKIVSSWVLPSPPQGALEKVLVLAMMQNREERDNIEAVMARELQNEGITAVTATSIFGPKRFEGQTEDEITAKLRNSDFTSVMLVSLVDKKRERYYNPGSAYYYPAARVGYNRYYRRYALMYDYMYTPGYYTTSTKYVLEADIYALRTDELIYSAQTKSYDPSSSRALAESFSKAIVNELNSKGFFP